MAEPGPPAGVGRHASTTVSRRSPDRPPEPGPADSAADTGTGSTELVALTPVPGRPTSAAHPGTGPADPAVDPATASPDLGTSSQPSFVACASITA
ncbi:hypothetical protein [Streptomyces sp. LMG1-1-1.1]|uniref:hypothetical protein n=1 Tax=Streptomyces sp. LMG1-1-1.1 TaxID=3135245 RepID=UPI003466A0C1